MSDPTTTQAGPARARAPNPAGLLVLIAIVVVIVGAVGFFIFEEYIYREPRILAATVCCLPAAGLAGVLVIFALIFMRGHATVTIGPRLRPGAPAFEDGGRRGTQPSDTERTERIAELSKKRKSLVSLLSSLDEQHQSGLLFDDAYRRLKSKYLRELSEIDTELTALKQLDRTLRRDGDRDGAEDRY